MSDQLRTVSADAKKPTENLPVHRVERSDGSQGSFAADPPADGILVAGKRETPLPTTVRRVGVETVIGVDERTLVRDTRAFPWRAIASLALTSRSGEGYIGTGWFVGPKTLITAGHCVYSESDFGGWIASIDVVPGRSGSSAPFGSRTAVKFSTLDRWMSHSDADYDVGCIHLAEPFKEDLGWFATASLSDADLRDQLLNVSGYPGDRDNGTEQYHHANRVLKPAARRIYYDIDTYGGQSGSPVWLQRDGGPVAVGIHAYGVGGTPTSLNITANSAPRITADVVGIIRGWLTEADA